MLNVFFEGNITSWNCTSNYIFSRKCYWRSKIFILHSNFLYLEEQTLVKSANWEFWSPNSSSFSQNLQNVNLTFNLYPTTTYLFHVKNLHVMDLYHFILYYSSLHFTWLNIYRLRGYNIPLRFTLQNLTALLQLLCSSVRYAHIIFFNPKQPFFLRGIRLNKSKKNQWK